MNIPHTCAEVLDVGEINLFGESRVGAPIVILAGLYFLVSLLILYLIHLQKHHAEEGDDKAVKAVIFPIFTYVLWANAGVNIYVAVITLAFDIRTMGESSRNGQLYAFSVMYGIQHIVTEGVAFMLMQKGVGMNAAKRSLRYASVWGIVTFVCYSIEYSGRNKHAQQFFGFLWNILLLIFYGALWLTPQKRLYRRPALMLYAQFWFFFRILCIVVLVLYAFSATADAAQCLNVFGTLYTFSILEPIVLYYTLLQDSRWWQGLDISQGRRQESVEEIRSPLQGMDLAMDSAQSLAAQLDSFGGGGLRRRLLDTASSAITTSTSSAKTVRLLNFAYIKLDRTKMLGSGSFSKVYMGKYRNRQCAIKLVFTLDLTREIIRRVAAEAQLLSSIRHPNIVEIVGVSVLPPSVCLLLELCHYGSLADIIHGTGAMDLLPEIRDQTLPPNTPIFPSGISNSNHNNRGSLVPGDIESGGLRLSESLQGFLRPSSPTHHQSSTPVHSVGSVTPAINPLQHAANVVPFIEEFMRGGPTIAFANKRHLALSWNDRLHLAIGCARGLHALHTFAHNLCHRDVKSFNFLVDEHLNAKLSDLELGTAEEYGSNKPKKERGHPGRDPGTHSKESVSSVASSSLSRFSLTSKNRTESKEVSELGIGEGILQADEFLANWAAPEVIKTGHHVQSSDVYSFGMVLWEMLSGRVPFSEVRRQDDIRFQVLSGQRPVIPKVFTRAYSTGMNGEPNQYAVHFDAFIDLIERCWAHEPHQRPEMAEVLHDLQEIYEQRCYQIVRDTDAIHKAKDHINAYVQQKEKEKELLQQAPAPAGQTSQAVTTANAITTPNTANINNSHSSAAGLSLPRFSLFGNVTRFAKDRFQNELTPEETMLIVQTLQSNESSSPILEQFALRNEAWVLVLPPPICQVIWATVEWQELVGLSLQDVAGKPFRNLSIFAPPNNLDRTPKSTSPQKSASTVFFGGKSNGPVRRRSRFSLSAHSAHQKFLTAWYDGVSRVFHRMKDTEKNGAPFHTVMELTLPNFLNQQTQETGVDSAFAQSDVLAGIIGQGRPSTDSFVSTSSLYTAQSGASHHHPPRSPYHAGSSTMSASTLYSASSGSQQHGVGNYRHNPVIHIGGGKQITFSLHVYPIFDSTQNAASSSATASASSVAASLSTSLTPSSAVPISAIATNSVSSSVQLGSSLLNANCLPNTTAATSDVVHEVASKSKLPPLGLLTPKNDDAVNFAAPDENEEPEEDADAGIDEEEDEEDVANSTYSNTKKNAGNDQEEEEEDGVDMNESDEDSGKQSPTGPAIRCNIRAKESLSHKSDLSSNQSDSILNVRDEEDRQLTEAVLATKRAAKQARQAQRRLEKEEREKKRQRARERTNSNTIPGHAGANSPIHIPGFVTNVPFHSTSDKLRNRKLTLLAVLFSPLYDSEIEKSKSASNSQPQSSQQHHVPVHLSNSHSAATAASAIAAAGIST